MATGLGSPSPADSHGSMRLPPLITLTTDFGTGGGYVAQMKGVLLIRIPDVRLVDITHDVPPQNVPAAAIVLADTLVHFPDGAVHVGVVDPGVGTDRPILAGRCRNGFFVGPDNGLFSLCEIQEAVALDQPRYWLADVSRTFHGRDIMAPVAAALAGGTRLRDLGRPVTHWQTLETPPPDRDGGRLTARVLTSDSFGNLITNLTSRDLPGAAIARVPDGAIARAVVRVAGKPIPLVGCYGEREPGHGVALLGSSGRLEIAVVNGSAKDRYGANPPIIIDLADPDPPRKT